MGGIPTTDFAIACNSKLSQIENDIITFFRFFVWFDDHIQQVLGLKFSKKLNRCILGFLNKPTIFESCMFPLANPQHAPIVDFLHLIFTMI